MLRFWRGRRARRSARFFRHAGLALAVLAVSVPPARAATGYPATAAEARRIRDSLEADVAAERGKPSPREGLTRAREEYVGLLRDIEALHVRAEELAREQAGRTARETAARNTLAKPVSIKPTRGAPSAEQVSILSGNVQDSRRKLDAVRARRASLEAERESGLKTERERAAARRGEAEARLAAFQAELPRLRAAASTLDEQQALEVRAHVLDLAVAHATRWLDLLARRGGDLAAEIAVLDLETEAAAKAVERGDAELRTAWDAEKQTLDRAQREAAAAHRAAAGDIDAAQKLGEWEHLLQQWRTDTLSLDARTAARKRELVAVQSSGLRADALENATARFAQLEERYQKSRAVGIDTMPLVKRGLDRVARDRQEFLVNADLARWRIARVDAVAALEDVENQLSDLDETLRSTLAAARDAWLAASDAPNEVELWESEERPIWAEDGRHRRESLRALADALREVSDEYQARLERVTALGEVLDREERWLMRRAVLARVAAPHPVEGARKAWRDYREWSEGGREVRFLVLAGLVALVAGWAILVRRLRTFMAGWMASASAADAKQLAARRAWQAVARRASWAPLAPLLGWLAASVIDANRDEAQALRGAGWLAAGVVAVYALVRGLLSAVPDELSARRYRTLAGGAAFAMLLLGVPLYYLQHVGYAVSNPDLVALLDRLVRLTLAIALVGALTSPTHLVALLPGRAGASAPRALAPMRWSLLVAVIATVIADWLGYEPLASWLFTAAFGSILVLGLGVAGGRSAFHALRHSPEATISDLLAGERSAFLMQQARAVVMLATLGATVWGLLLAMRVAPADLQVLASKQIWPFRTEGTAGLTLGSVFAATAVVITTIVLARALRGVLDHFVLAWAGVDRDLRYSVATVTHYLILLFGCTKALGRLGVNLKDLQWLLAAAGVGIGFGLQEIVSNFVSGIIILFERPLKIGDVIEVDGKPGEVVDVSIRSTAVRTLDNKFVLIPNKEIITQRLTNFTGNDPKVRIQVPVGVALDVDPGPVRDVLLEVARRHGRVYKRPPPDVLFEGRGPTSLDLLLRAWVHVKDRDEIASDLGLAIESALRREGIHMPFTETFVHLSPAPEPGKESDAGTRSVP